MPSLVANCPHCGSLKMGFTYRSQYSNLPGHFFVIGSCNGCLRPLAVYLRKLAGGNWDPSTFAGDLMSDNSILTLDTWPQMTVTNAPDDVPEKVGRCYLEAAEARKRRSWNAACSMYRRTMELGLKAFCPEIEAWKLEKRIDKLAAENKITSDIQAWAHELRLDRNEALHGDADATEDMTDQMHHLTHFLLVYLYSLPEQIQIVRARRNAASAD